MNPNTKVYLIPLTEEWYTKQIPGQQWVFSSKYIYVISEEKLEFEFLTLKELSDQLGYNPFEQTEPTPESDVLMTEIALNLDYLICLADLGLLGGGE